MLLFLLNETCFKKAAIIMHVPSGPQQQVLTDPNPTFYNDALLILVAIPRQFIMLAASLVSIPTLTAWLSFALLLPPELFFFFVLNQLQTVIMLSSSTAGDAQGSLSLSVVWSSVIYYPPHLFFFSFLTSEITLHSNPVTELSRD